MAIACKRESHFTPRYLELLPVFPPPTIPFNSASILNHLGNASEGNIVLLAGRKGVMTEKRATVKGCKLRLGAGRNRPLFAAILLRE